MIGQRIDYFTHQNFGGRCSRSQPKRIDTVEPVHADIFCALDQIRLCPGTRCDLDQPKRVGTVRRADDEY